MTTTHIGTTEIRRLMQQSISYARHCQSNSNPRVARQHAADALAYAAELDRRAA